MPTTYGLPLFGLLIALAIQQLRNPPVVLHATAIEPFVEAISVSPQGSETIFWCSDLRGRSARCFSSTVGRETLPIFLGGAIDEADMPLEPAFRKIRHFSFRGGAIQWHDGQPSFIIGCLTGGLSAVCEQKPVSPPAVIGKAIDPIETTVRATGNAVIWSDTTEPPAQFRSGDATLALCCAGELRAFAVADLPDEESVLVYAAPAGRHADLRAALFGADLSVRREIVLAHDILPPEAIAAVSAAGRLAVVWSSGTVFAATGPFDRMVTVKLSDHGVAPAVATDGKRVIAAWQSHGPLGEAITIAEIRNGTADRSLVALGASQRNAPYLAIHWSATTGFVIFWRVDRSDGSLDIARRSIP